MQKTIVSALAVLASVVSASAADLPSKSAAAAPVFATGGYYAGLNLGADADKARVYSGGAVAGWNALPFLAVEGTYDFSRPDAKVGGKWNYGNTVAVNVVPQYKIPGTDVTAYALGGVGYKWNTKAADYSVYNVGAGLKYDFAKNIELDARYRRIDAVEKKVRTTATSEDRITAGVNYKF
jgi:opacity protein-like surface antigen